MTLYNSIRLNQDCLVKLNGKYKLVTDIPTTNVLDHTVTISDGLILAFGSVYPVRINTLFALALTGEVS